MDTKTKILDTAERIFADQGFDGTSLRQIIGKAGVNLAAVHYHFKSKDALLEAIVQRRAEPVNRERIAMLDRFEAAGRTATVEQIMEAFLLPVFTSDFELSTFGRLMGRLHAEGHHLARIAEKYFGEIVARFSAALRRALPDVPPAEIYWRMHFVIGAMAHTLRGAEELKVLGARAPKKPTPKDTARRLIAFASAGLQSRSDR